MLHLWHMKIPGLGVKLELQLLAYAAATSTWDSSRICNIRCSLRHRWILNPLSEARHRTHILSNPSHWQLDSTAGTPSIYTFERNHTSAMTVSQRLSKV